MVKNIIFDCSGTVVRFIAKDVLADTLGDKERAAKIHSTIYNSPEWDQYGLGNMTFEQMKERVYPLLDEADRPIADEWLKSRGVNYTVMEGMPELIKTLKQNGYKLYILSNYPDYFDILWNKFDIFRMFDGRCISFKHHASKGGDGALFGVILDKYALKADECILVDDVESNSVNSAKYGIKGFVFESTDTLILQLREYGINI